MSDLHEQFVELAAGVPVYGDLDRAIERARRDRRRHHGAIAALTAAAAVIAVVVSVVAITDDDAKSLPPVAPATTPAPTESPSRPVWSPPMALRQPSHRVVSRGEDIWGNPTKWADGRDATSGEIDIRSINSAERSFGGGDWQFSLASRVPADPVDRVVSYGVDVDGDRDLRADCQFGINNDGPKPGEFHIWVTNLRTHETRVQEGPPYGIPVEFSHPAEPGMAEDFPNLIQMSFTFLTPKPTPCDSFGKTPVFYAWSAVSRNGSVTARDFAPDNAWLTMR